MSGGSKFTSYIPRVVQLIHLESYNNLVEATMIWHEGIVETLTGDRSGNEYRIPGGKRTYRASRPGEAPASRTGRLRSSYRYRIVERGGELIGEVGSPLEYALFLEKGTSRMAPRPHVKPAYEKREGDIKQALGRRFGE